MSPAEIVFAQRVDTIAYRRGLSVNATIDHLCPNVILLKFYDYRTKQLLYEYRVGSWEIRKYSGDINPFAEHIAYKVASIIEERKKKEETVRNLNEFDRFMGSVTKYASLAGLNVCRDFDHVRCELRITFRRGPFCCSQIIDKFTLDRASINGLESLAHRIVQEACEKIDDIVREQMAESRRVYITTGRGCGKTMMTNEFLKKKFNIIEEKDNMITKNSIKDVIFNPPATIVMWKDGTKTVVKAQNDEAFDPEKGLAMAIAKKALGNQGNYFEAIKKWTENYKPAKQKVVSDIPKSKGERWCIFHHGYGWVKGRKYVRVMGKKIFHDYIYTNDKSEAMTWKTEHGAEKNARGLRSATVLKF